jgi:hypothetical protein
MNIAVQYANVNVHGNDAQGAFVPQALRFEKRMKSLGHNVVMFPFDPTSAHFKGGETEVRKRFLLDVKAASLMPGSLDAWVYFGHGTRTGLPSAKLALSDIPTLVQMLLVDGPSLLTVVLYACSTASTPKRYAADEVEGDGGFADELRDELTRRGCAGHVDAHTTAAHTTTNPFVRRFVMEPEAMAQGGSWLVEPGSEFWRTWRAALSDPGDTLRFDFPWMNRSELHDRLVYEMHLRAG